jgi:hypothetical protein
MLVYVAPERSGEAMAANIVVGRDALAEDETFREFCTRQINTFRDTLPHFHREDEGSGRIHERDAFQIRFTWSSGVGLLRQRVFFISAGDGAVVSFAATAAADAFEQHVAVFDATLASLVIEPVAQHPV